jgi:hypothetical protein
VVTECSFANGDRWNGAFCFGMVGRIAWREAKGKRNETKG